MRHGVASFALGLALIGFAGTARAQERRTVAILPVVVHALQDQAYLREGLADMLASRLGQQPGIGVLRVNDPAKATLDAAAARATAQAVGAQWVLFGSFTRFGDGASLDVQCLSVDGSGSPSPRSIFVQAGQIGELIPRLDGIAARVASHVMGRNGEATSAPGGDATQRELAELRRRVEALEQRAAASARAPRPPAAEAQGAQ